MKTEFFQTKQFRLFFILIMTIVVLIIFCVSAFSYYYAYYKEVFDYRAYLNSLLQNAQSLINSPKKNMLDPYLGNPDATITLYLISDYQLPASANANSVVDEVYKFYGVNNLQVVWKDYATTDIAANKDAAAAAHCANMQGKFWEFKNALLLSKEAFNSDLYLKIARENQMDTVTFSSCYQKNIFGELINSNYSEIANLGIGITPVIYINNQKIDENINFNTLRTIIDNQLAQ